jgi:Sec7-like guanine-nucleotide exchange factor
MRVENMSEFNFKHSKTCLFCNYSYYYLCRMKSARIITKVSKRTKAAAIGSDISAPVPKTKASPNTTSSPNSIKKISAATQFKRIKAALDEVELIEAGQIKPASLKEALNEL